MGRALPPLRGEPFSDHGSFGTLWPDPENDGYLIKVFKSDGNPVPLSGDKAAKVDRILGVSAEVRKSTWQVLSTRMSWCVEAFDAPGGKISGIRIPRAPDEFFIEFKVFGEPQRRPLDLSFLVSEFLGKPAVADADFTEVPFEDRIEIAFELVTVFQFLWSANYYFSDVSSRNILWSLKPAPRVFLIDADSIIRPDEEGDHSPDWLPLPGLSVPEGDRALVALAIWRILSIDSHSYPDGSSESGFLSRIQPDEKKSLLTVWKTGSAKALNEIRDWLSSYRKREYVDQKFLEAVNTGFARLVLAYAPIRPTAGQATPIEAAAAQRDKELDLEGMAPFARAVRLRTENAVTGFDFDLSQEKMASISHGDDWSVIDLVLDGKFIEVAEGVIDGVFGDDPSPICVRAVELTLAGFGTPEVNQRWSDERLRLDCSWPGWTGVSGLRVKVCNATGRSFLDEFVSRTSAGPGLWIDRSRLPDESLTVEMRLCSSPVGLEIVSPAALTIALAARKPVENPTRTPIRAGTTTMPSGPSQMIAPETNPPRTLSQPKVIVGVRPPTPPQPPLRRDDARAMPRTAVTPARTRWWSRALSWFRKSSK